MPFMWLLIWAYIVCKCSIKVALGMNGVNIFAKAILAFLKRKDKGREKIQYFGICKLSKCV